MEFPDSWFLDEVRDGFFCRGHDEARMGGAA